ncbi:MAG TPA: hypothetical protein VGL16_08775 [Actinomycetota bacterium]
MPQRQSPSEFTVGTIEASGVVMLEHPRRGVAEPERDHDGVRTGLQRAWLPLADDTHKVRLEFLGCRLDVRRGLRTSPSAS